MARPIVLSNGEMHVGINKFGLVHDFYFPYVGLDNHSAGQDLRHRVGVWTDGRVSWLDDGSWEFNFSYPHQALIGKTVATNDSIGIQLEFDDFVDAEQNAFMRNIHVINRRDHKRDVRLFMHQAFNIGDSKSHTDTAQYLPDSDSVLHYRGRRAFIVSGTSNGQPFDQHAIGLFGIEGREGTYKDAEDGELLCGNIEHGRVDSTLRFKLELGEHSSERVLYWIAAGTSTRNALHVDKQIRDNGFFSRMHATASWWSEWIQPAKAASRKLAPKYQDLFIKSVMIIKSQMDKRGAIMASTDTTMLNYSRDAYAYSWPRDGAYIIWPMIRMGYFEEAERFFEFCLAGLHPAGYLMHKYRADGALGSSWHPYVQDGINAAPIQEDETALTLFVFSQYYSCNPSKELLDKYYESMIVPMAEFMSSYVCETTGLPRPTYDLWEEVFLTTTYTTSTVYAGLLAAASLAEDAGDNDRAVKWRSAAGDIQRAAHKYLFNSERQAFYKGLIIKNGQIEYNDTIDNSAIFGAFMYELFEVDSDELKSAMRTSREVFGMTRQNPALPRYENDYYQRVSESITGNWWFITSIWMAQYMNETGDKDEAEVVFDWVNSQALSTGVLSEQISPLNNDLISVAPLTWSHAEFVSAMLDTVVISEQQG